MDLTELVHKVVREDPSSAWIVRAYSTGFNQLVDAAVKADPGVDKDALREALYRFLLPGEWAAKKYDEAVKKNPNITGHELAEILRSGISEECEHGRSISGGCLACETMPGQDVSDGALDTAQEDIDALKNVLQRLRQWDMLDACSDGPWAKALIDGVLEKTK
jgi:hypothetical protein